MTPKIIWSSHKVASPGLRPPWKTPLNEACPHGLKIMLVDGTYVRNTWESDFSQGGNGYAFGFIPKDEIWIDACIPNEEWSFIAYHECVEVEYMKKGLTYNQAHDKAKRQEDSLRRGTSATKKLHAQGCKRA